MTKNELARHIKVGSYVGVVAAILFFVAYGVLILSIEVSTLTSSLLLLSAPIASLLIGGIVGTIGATVSLVLSQLASAVTVEEHTSRQPSGSSYKVPKKYLSDKPTRVESIRDNERYQDYKDIDDESVREDESCMSSEDNWDRETRENSTVNFTMLVDESARGLSLPYKVVSDITIGQLLDDELYFIDINNDTIVTIENVLENSSYSKKDYSVYEQNTLEGISLRLVNPEDWDNTIIREGHSIIVCDTEYDLLDDQFSEHYSYYNPVANTEPRDVDSEDDEELYDDED